MQYIGQTGGPSHVRFQERFRDKKYANNKSKFTQHLIDNNHSIGPIENIMGLIHTTSKGKMLDTMEKFYIYRETQMNNQLNDKCIVKPNVIF